MVGDESAASQSLCQSYIDVFAGRAREGLRVYIVYYELRLCVMLQSSKRLIQLT